MFSALSRHEPWAVTLTPVAGGFMFVGTLRLRREQKNLSPVIRGEGRCSRNGF